MIDYVFFYMILYVYCGLYICFIIMVAVVLSGALHIPVIVAVNSATLDIVSYIRMYQKSVLLDDP